MKSTNPNQAPFPIEFTGDNTLFVPKGDDMLTSVLAVSKELKSEGKTVVITDSYIFKPKPVNANHVNEVIKVLTSLKAKKIVFVSERGWGDKTIRTSVEQALSSQGCTVEYHSKKNIHDRLWICVEEKTGLDMHSLNGIGISTCVLTPLLQADVEAFIQYLVQRGVLNNASASE